MCIIGVWARAGSSGGQADAIRRPTSFIAPRRRLAPDDASLFDPRRLVAADRADRSGDDLHPRSPSLTILFLMILFLVILPRPTPSARAAPFGLGPPGLPTHR